MWGDMLRTATERADAAGRLHLLATAPTDNRPARRPHRGLTAPAAAQQTPSRARGTCSGDHAFPNSPLHAGKELLCSSSFPSTPTFYTESLNIQPTVFRVFNPFLAGLTFSNFCNLSILISSALTSTPCLCHHINFTNSRNVQAQLFGA